MNFEKDYLADLEPVITELFRCGAYEVAEQIEDCKEAGSTGGEILDCITYRLRQSLKVVEDQQAVSAIKEYLQRAKRSLTE